MWNFSFRKNKSDVATESTRQLPSQKLSSDQLARLKIYMREIHYAEVPPDDAPKSDDLYLREIYDGANLKTIKDLPDWIVGVANPVPRIVAIDTSAITNALSIDRVRVADDKDNKATDELQVILSENKFSLLLNRLVSLGAACGDVYLCVSSSDRLPSGVRLSIYSPTVTFPYFNPHDYDDVEKYKIIYQYKDTLDRLLIREVTYTAEGIEDEGATYPLPLPGKIPIFHVAHIPQHQSFYGLPTCHGLYDTIDQLNKTWGTLEQANKFYALPRAIVKGAKPQTTKRLEANPRVAYHIGRDDDMYLLEWRGGHSLQATIDQLTQEIRTRVPHFVLDEISAGESGESIKHRLQLLLNHFTLLQNQYGAALSAAMEYILRMKGRPDDVRVELDWGENLAVQKSIHRMEVLDLYDRGLLPWRYAMEQLGYTSEQLDEMEPLVNQQKAPIGFSERMNNLLV